MTAKKSLGQNFLIDPNIQRRIVAALEAGPEDEVLEIGPGRGALTRHLAGRVRRLVAIEMDDALARELHADLAEVPGVEIVQADALKRELEEFTDEPAALKIIGNIPYNITTPLLFHLLERRARPARIVIMVQREVADRILAAPGEKAYGALSVGVRTVAEVTRLFHVGRAAFRPVPDVDSTVLRLQPYQPPPLDAELETELRTLTRVAFGWRRKQLQKILRTSTEYDLDPNALTKVTDETGLDLERRPETLAPADFVRLARTLRVIAQPRRSPARNQT